MLYLVDGNWLDWNDWSDCPVTYGGGEQKRTRTCTDPPPAFGGEKYPGEGEETRPCNKAPCPSNNFLVYAHFVLDFKNFL